MAQTGGSAVLLCWALHCLTNRIIAMLLLLLFGATPASGQSTLLAALRDLHIEPRLPTFALTAMTFATSCSGTLFLALPDSPHARQCRDRDYRGEQPALSQPSINESKISTSTGLMNLLSASVGGVPMCHGAGGA